MAPNIIKEARTQLLAFILRYFTCASQVSLQVSATVRVPKVIKSHAL